MVLPHRSVIGDRFVGFGAVGSHLLLLDMTGGLRGGFWPLPVPGAKIFLANCKENPSTDWLPMTMKCSSPVVPLDARRMCSRSARFISFENLPPLLLRHQQRKGAALAHPGRVFAAILQHPQHTGHAFPANHVHPFLQRILAVHGEVGIAHAVLDPGTHEPEFLRGLPQDIRDHLIHLVAALIHDLMPVHGASLSQPAESGNCSHRFQIQFAALRPAAHSPP